MRRSSLFGHIVELLDLVPGSRQPADALVQEFTRRRHYLGARDRRVITQIFYGILRQYRTLDAIVRQAVSASRPEVKLRHMPSAGFVAAYVMKTEGEGPESLHADIAGLWRMGTADIDPAVFLARLKDAVAAPELPSDPVRRAAIEHSLPDQVVAEWYERFGAAETEALCRSMNEPAPVTIRVNTLRCTVDECRAALAAEGVVTRRTVHSPLGLVLEKRVNLRSLKSYQNGFFEPQDEGSQILGFLVDAAQGDTIVDACAGGGGKTLHLAAEMKNTGSIFAFDVEEGRLRNLLPRARRAGVSIARTVLLRDGRLPEIGEGTADAVLIDAPCSGIGTYRRNPGAKLGFSREHSTSLQKVQSELLERYAPLVRPGGRLVYSTCTLVRGENEERVQEFARRHSEFRLASATAVLRKKGVSLGGESLMPAGDDLTLFLLPHRTGTDGFFAALFVREL